jgi:hypothetical protein
MSVNPVAWELASVMAWPKSSAQRWILQRKDVVFSTTVEGH